MMLQLFLRCSMKQSGRGQMANGQDFNDDFHSLDFDVKLEIEKLQATIRSMSNFSDDSEGFLSQSPKALMDGGFNLLPQEAEFDPYSEIEKPVVRNNGPKPKKFVVMVNPENIDFFDKIPMDERTELFNNLLQNHKKSLEYTKNKKRMVKFTKHMFVGIMTVLLSLPVMFLVVNKSIELTINNYKDVQNSFEKLYESKHSKYNSSVHRTVY